MDAGRRFLPRFWLETAFFDEKILKKLEKNEKKTCKTEKSVI